MGQRRQTARTLKLSFFILNIYALILNFGGLFIVGLNNMFTMYVLDIGKICNTPNSSQPLSQQDYGHWKVIFTILLCTMTIKIKEMDQQENKRALLKKMLWENIIMAMHLIFIYIFFEILKIAIGIAQPYFFSNETLKNFYCENGTEKKTIGNEGLQMSFPSLRAAAYGYCLTYMFLHLDHVDIERGFYVTQGLLIVLTFQIFRVMYQHWRNEETHLNDIFVGLLLGMLQAIMAILCVFGKIFRPHVDILNTHSTSQPDDGRAFLQSPPSTPVHHLIDSLTENSDTESSSYESAM